MYFSTNLTPCCAAMNSRVIFKDFVCENHYSNRKMVINIKKNYFFYRVWGCDDPIFLKLYWNVKKNAISVEFRHWYESNHNQIPNIEWFINIWYWYCFEPFVVNFFFNLYSQPVTRCNYFSSREIQRQQWYRLPTISNVNFLPTYYLAINEKCTFSDNGKMSDNGGVARRDFYQWIHEYQIYLWNHWYVIYIYEIGNCTSFTREIKAIIKFKYGLYRHIAFLIFAFFSLVSRSALHQQHGWPYWVEQGKVRVTKRSMGNPEKTIR